MSPMPGRSTLITSAPWSASNVAAYGPVSAIDRSRTRTPCIGPVLTRYLGSLDELLLGAGAPGGSAVREPVGGSGGEVRDDDRRLGRQPRVDQGVLGVVVERVGED